MLGQHDAVRTISVAAAQHYARIAYEGEVPMKKANVLIIGPTGSGKTQTVRALAQYLDVPFAQVTASAITQPGFTGLDPDAVLQMLVAKAGKGNKAAAERGIAYIDEIDKIARRPTDNEDAGKNVTTGLGVQQALLDVLDASTWTFANGQTMDASGVLFILSGAFVGIERVVANRMRGRTVAARPSSMSVTEALREVEPADLIAYGLIPEFVGRCPVLAKLRPLDAHEILQILSVPKDAPLRRLVAEFEAVGVELVVDDGFLRAIANEAIQKGTGARALEGTIRAQLQEAFYNAERGDRVVVTEGGAHVIHKGTAPAPPPTSPEGAEQGTETAPIQ